MMMFMVWFRVILRMTKGALTRKKIMQTRMKPVEEHCLQDNATTKTKTTRMKRNNMAAVKTKRIRKPVEGHR